THILSLQLYSRYPNGNPSTTTIFNTLIANSCSSCTTYANRRNNLSIARYKITPTAKTRSFTAFSVEIWDVTSLSTSLAANLVALPNRVTNTVNEMINTTSLSNLTPVQANANCHIRWFQSCEWRTSSLAQSAKSRMLLRFAKSVIEVPTIPIQAKIWYLNVL